MNGPRFSIAGLMTLVGVIALDCAILVQAASLWDRSASLAVCLLIDVLPFSVAGTGIALLFILRPPARRKPVQPRATMMMPEPPLPVTRRSLLIGSAAAAVAAGARPGIEAGRAAVGAEPDPARPRKVIDCHAHLRHHSRPNWADEDRRLIEAGDRLGIDQFCCSTLTPRRPSTAEGFRDCNRWTADAMKQFPGRVLGYCYVNPGYKREALDEVRRCIEDRGFVGIKLYNEYVCTDPIVFPVIELAIELRVPILHHAGHLHYFLEDQPHISDGGQLAELSRRYPEAMLICAHICGGGDWEWTIKALRHAPGVSLDLSGSVTDDGVVEMAARVLGVDRLLFGCDMSMTASVGRLRGADLAPDERRKILGENMERLLARRRT